MLLLTMTLKKNLLSFAFISPPVKCDNKYQLDLPSWDGTLSRKQQNITTTVLLLAGFPKSASLSVTPKT